MAHTIYHHHRIVSSPVYDDDSGRWKYAVAISWSGSVTRHMHSIKDCRELFSRFEDAENAGLEAAKNWVESKAKKPLRSDLRTRSIPGYRTRG
jgi:hypothetical protein